MWSNLSISSQKSRGVNNKIRYLLFFVKTMFHLTTRNEILLTTLHVTVPGLMSAGSNVSILLVAMTTFKQTNMLHVAYYSTVHVAGFTIVVLQTPFADLEQITK